MIKSTIKSLAVFVLLGSLSSCLKENEGTVLNVDKGNQVVEFANTGDNFAGVTSKYPNFYTDLGSLAVGESAEFNLNLQYAGSEKAGSDITVKLGVDQEALDLYNTQNGSHYEVPPASVFSFPETVVIKQGSNIAQVKAVVTRSADYDFSAAYALPLKIVSASAGTISANFGKAVFSFGVRNSYDGHYSLKGYSLRAGDAAKTGNFVYDPGMDLATVGATTVQFGALQVWADKTGVGIGNPILTVNPADGKVTISSSGGAYNAPGYDSRYDATTKTFYISFAWGAGPSARLATDTMTYVGER
jgi:hypothetical protein